jgi:hypothetical protein
MGAAFVTALPLAPGTIVPEIALNEIRVPIAEAALRNPRAVASLSVSKISLDASEVGSLPAKTTGSALEDLSGGSEMTRPVGGAGALADAGAAGAGADVFAGFVNVPDMPT